MDTSIETKVANAPFNTDFADAILRTSDKIDFYVHIPILRMASTVFGDMFTTPQPPSEARPTQTAPFRPIVNITEDSATIDCVLRYCYPVLDPTITDLDVLDRVLTAADKYNIDLVHTLAAQVLNQFVQAKPFAVYVVACLNNCEEVARKAAVAWKGTKSLWSDHASILEDTPVGASHHELLARLPAGPYYRLLQYLRGQPVERFCTLSSQPSHLDQGPNETQAENTRLQYPFNCADVDIVFRSAEGHDLHVHKLVIELQYKFSSTTACRKFKLSPGKFEEHRPVAATDLPLDVLACLLRLCYPMLGDDHLMNWDVKKLVSPKSLCVVRAAARYGFKSVTQMYTSRLRQVVSQDPLAVYCTAVHLGLSAAAREAVEQLALRRPSELYSADVETLSAQNYYELLKCYYQIQTIIFNVVSMENIGRKQTLGQNLLAFTYGGKMTAKISTAKLVDEVEEVINSGRYYKYDFYKIIKANDDMDGKIKQAVKNIVKEQIKI